MKTFSKRPAQHERLASRPCTVCGSDSTAPYWDCGDFRFERCRRCGHVYQNPQPLSDDLGLRYDWEYFQYELDNAEQFYQLMKKGLQDLDFFAHERRLRECGLFLDLGCATGVLLQKMRQRGWRVQGVEICEPAARYAVEHRSVPVHLGPVESAPLAEGSCAVVHTSHVIEHVPDPRLFLQRIHHLLCPGGLAVIVTPDRSGFQARLFGRRWRSAIADHVNLFSSAQLIRLMRELGFSVVRKRSWGGLAAGSALPLFKRPADSLAKAFNIGDVCAILVRKPA